MQVHSKRTRLPAKAAKARILEAAERQLIAGGPASVRVQALARELGLTDAAIYHHFGSRDGLLAALLRFGGRRLRQEIVRVTSSWDGSSVDLEGLMDQILAVFEDRGYARLALWLWLAGHENKGRGFFDEFVRALNLARRRRAKAEGWPQPSERETRRRAALFASTLFAEPILGDASRRSVSLPTTDRATTEYRRWLAQTFRSLMLAPDEPSGALPPR